MGTVNFNTNVNKNIDLNKQVDLNVAKDVLSAVDIRGNLATAEASADAVGGDGGDVVIGREKIPFIPDDLSQGQQVFANPNPASGFTNPVTDTILVPASDTDFINPLSRTLAVEVTTTEGQGNLAVELVASNEIAFNQPVGGASNAYSNWDIEGGEDPFPLDDNNGILQDYADAPKPGGPFDLTNVCYTFTFNNVDFDPGVAGNTARASFIVFDTDGNYAITTAVFIPDDETGTGFEDLEFTGAFAAFINPALNPPPGTVIAAVNLAEVGGSNAAADSARVVQLGIESDVDGNGEAVNFDNLAGFQVLFEDAPEQTLAQNALIGVAGDLHEPGLSSADFFPLDDLVDENPSEFGTDTGASLIWTTCREVVRPGEGNLAETDTFAQVSPEGAFSFSEALAASNPVVVDTFDFA